MSSASSASRGSARSAGSTPATTSAPSRPAAAAAMMPSVSRPGWLGMTPASRSHAPASSARAAASVTEAAAGQQVGQAAGVDRAAVTGAPRHPGQLRAGTRRPAPPRPTGHPGRVASRSPTSRTAPGCAQRLARPRRARRARRASSPGHDPGDLGAELLQPAGDERRERVHRQLRLVYALRSRRKRIGHSSSGSRPTMHHGRRALDVGVGDVGGAGRPRQARNSASSRGERPGPEVDVVGAQRDPGELGVRVRVLDGQPAAGQHADAVRAVAGVAQPLGGDARAPRSRTPRAARRCAASRTSGVVMPVGGGGVLEAPAALVAVPLLVDRRVVAGQPAHAPCPGGGRCAARSRPSSARTRSGVETRSNGRARNRYWAPVSAPTGQICTVLPEK